VIRLALRVRREDSELVLADLLELAPSGVEETDLPGELIEYAIYGAPGELPVLPDLKAVAGEALVEISTSEIADDWSERWRDFHQPITISSPDPAKVSSLRVRTPWESSISQPHTQEIVIDPGQAFGTGSHATTRLCLELLLQLASLEGERGALLDLGAGSGVLAIAAAKLGYGPVLALDHDPLSVKATQENAAVNDVRLQAHRFDLRRDPWPSQPNTQASVILANLLRPLLIDLAGALEHPPRQLIASGLLVGEADQISNLFTQRLGMPERERRESGDWAALWLSGP
jgi:ribosomal protein L11 methyltransferase